MDSGLSRCCRYLAANSSLSLFPSVGLFSFSPLGLRRAGTCAPRHQPASFRGSANNHPAHLISLLEEWMHPTCLHQANEENEEFCRAPDMTKSYAFFIVITILTRYPPGVLVTRCVVQTAWNCWQHLAKVYLRPESGHRVVVRFRCAIGRKRPMRSLRLRTFQRVHR
jgi:hypothetical protein